MPRRRRGWGRIVVGVLSVLLGVVAILGAAFAIVGVAAISGTFSNEAEGVAPGRVTLETEDRRYVVALRSRSSSEGRAERTRCTVTHPDGSTSQLRGDRQAISLQTGAFNTVGEFDGRPGETTVECRIEADLIGGGDEEQFVVAEVEEGWRTAGFVLLGGGLVAVLGGVGLILWGARRR